MSDKNELQTVPEAQMVPVSEMSPIEVMQSYLNKGLDVDKIREMIQLQKEWSAIEAQKAYVESMAKFKKDPPEIDKDTNVNYTKKDGSIVNYNHASLGNVTSKINSALSKHGFSVAWITEQPDNSVKVTCKITHKLGHSEETTMQAPPDSSGGKNSIQAIASTVTYLERYTLLALTGLATHGQDNDGAGYEDIEYVGSKEKSQIRDLLTALDVDESSFLSYLEIDTLDKMTPFHYKTAIPNLEAKLEKKNADNS